MAVVCKEALKIYFIFALGILLEANGAEKRLVVGLSYIERSVNAAEIDEIKSASTHYEQRFKIRGVASLLVGRLVSVGELGYIVDKTALCCQLELTHTDKLSAYACGVCKKIGVEFDVTALAELFLLCL